MERTLTLGVLALQGAFAEHREALERAFAEEGVDGRVAGVRTPAQLAAVDGLALPGGESTTISRLLLASGLHEALQRRARDERFPLLATCAGLILVAKEGDRQVEGTDTRLLGLVDMAVDRNAFGRQRESFEAQVELPALGLEAPFAGVFIRAPAVTRTWGGAEPLGALGGRTVAVRQGNVLALAFHPELTQDARIHRAFVRSALAWKAARAAP